MSTPFTGTPEQRANLTKLADYLATGETAMQFDMGWYADAEPAEWECGTVACAAGHGPAAGIPARRGEGWVVYINRAFGDDFIEWSWCFSGAWTDVDNTPQGAAARIRVLLTDGLPDDWAAQMDGIVPLSYQVPQ